MKKLKLMTIVGTRPEIIRLSETIKKCDEYFEHILVHTGQNWDYTLNQVFFEDLGLRAPDYYLDSVGKDLGETMGNVIAKSYDVMVKEKPDAVIGLATGTTPLGLYNLLIKDHNENGTSYEHIKTLNLDEYLGLDINSKDSYIYFMRENLFKHIQTYSNIFAKLNR